VTARDRRSRGEEAARLADAAAVWLVDGAEVDDDDTSLYHGWAGVVLALHEAHEHLGDDRFGRAASRGADLLAARVEQVDECSLYFGLTGMAVALSALGRQQAAERALARVRAGFDGARRGPMNELLMGNAGIGLGAVDEQGARWSNHEHRAVPSELEPRAGWAMGDAGILRELIRYARLSQGLSGEYAVPWPDHPQAERHREESS
jgi:hypothetical protein